jgi:hypothetical protein
LSEGELLFGLWVLHLFQVEPSWVLLITDIHSGS